MVAAAVLLVTASGSGAGAFTNFVRSIFEGAPLQRRGQHRTTLSAGEVPPAFPDVPMWLDIRVSTKEKALGTLKLIEAAERNYEPDVKAVLAQLHKDVKQKFSNIGITQQVGPLVSGILVEEKWLDVVVNDTKHLGLDVVAASPNFKGSMLPGRALFVVNASTNKPIGAVGRPPINQAERMASQKVWEVVPKDRAVVEAERAKEAAEMERYRKGVNGELPYVHPPEKRMAQLFGGLYEDDNACLQVTRGEVLAEILTPNPLMWARVIMQRRKAKGHKIPTYRLRSDGP